MPFPDPSIDYYGILGVSPHATADEIREAGRRQAKTWHPDRRPDDHGAPDRMTLINAAREVLEDPGLRRRYDAQRRAPLHFDPADMRPTAGTPGVVVEFVAPDRRGTPKDVTDGDRWRAAAPVPPPAAVAAESDIGLGDLLVAERPPERPADGSGHSPPAAGVAPSRDGSLRGRPKRSRWPLVLCAVSAAGVAVFIGASRTSHSPRLPVPSEATPPTTAPSAPPGPPVATSPLPSADWNEQVQIVADANPDGVACTAPGSCVAVDSSSAALFGLTDGMWGNLASIPLNDATLRPGVNCGSARFCLVSTTSGVLLAFDGVVWRPAMTRTGLSPSVSCTTGGSCVVAWSDGLVQTFEGPTTLTSTAQIAAQLQDTPGPPRLSCVDAVSCVAVGADGTTVVETGGRWVRSAGSGVGAAPAAVSCASLSNCVAVATGDLLHFDGKTWSTIDTNTGVSNGDHRWVAVSCIPLGQCVSATADGIVTAIRDGSVGGTRTVDPNGMSALSCSTGTFCAGVDGRNAIVTFSPSDA